MHDYVSITTNYIHDNYIDTFLTLEHKVEMSALEGAIPQPLWGEKFQGKEVHGATGPSDILIVSQDETIQGEDTTPRRTTKLTSDDKRELERLDLPPDKWEDEATMGRTQTKNVPLFLSLPHALILYNEVLHSTEHFNQYSPIPC